MHVFSISQGEFNIPYSWLDTSIQIWKQFRRKKQGATIEVSPSIVNMIVFMGYSCKTY